MSLITTRSRVEVAERMKQTPVSAARSGAWGALAGIAGALCCVGPSAAVLLGLGSSSALAGLALDRRLTLAGGAALLLVGLALALRRARSCPAPGVARWRQPSLLLATFALSYGVLGWLLPNFAARQVEESTAAAPAPAPAAVSALRRATLTVEKMYCPPCAAHVRGALKRDPAVRDFLAETHVDQVIVVYDSRQTSGEQLARRFPRSYGVTVMSDLALP